jgi:ribosomal protein S18 acetylase RimI-like enzyme
MRVVDFESGIDSMLTRACTVPGVVSLEKGTERRPYLANLAVSPTFMRRGVGRMLVKAVEEEVRRLASEVCHAYAYIYIYTYIHTHNNTNVYIFTHICVYLHLHL